MSEGIVVAADGSRHSLAAVAWAAAEAAAAKEPLSIVYVAQPSEPQPGVDWPLLVTKEGREALQKAETAAMRPHPELEVSTRLRAGNVLEELVAESASARLLVTGSRGRGGFTGLLLGSTSMRIVAESNAPVVVVRERHDERLGIVVVGIDGSERSRHALAFAMDYAATNDAQVQAIYSWQIPVISNVEPGIGVWYDELEKANQEFVEHELAPWRDRYPHVALTGSAPKGHAALALCEAGRGADLIVLGTRGNSVAKSLVVGSVTNAVLHHAPCPVAVIGPRTSEATLVS